MVKSRSRDGCAVCCCKSSTSRFAQSRNWTEYLFNESGPFGRIEEPLRDEICNACVQVIKRYIKKPAKHEKGSLHLIKSRKGPGLKVLKKIKESFVLQQQQQQQQVAPSSPTPHVGATTEKPTGDDKSGSRKRKQDQTKIKHFVRNSNIDERTAMDVETSSEGADVFAHVDYRITPLDLRRNVDGREFKGYQTCCGTVFVDSRGCMIVPEASYRICIGHQIPAQSNRSPTYSTSISAISDPTDLGVNTGSSLSPSDESSGSPSTTDSVETISDEEASSVH